MGLNPSEVGSRLQLIVPGQETVTLYLRQNPYSNVYDPYVIQGVRRRPLTKQFPSQQSVGSLPVLEMQFDLYRPSMASSGLPSATLPRYQDYLIAAASETDNTQVTWVVQSVDAQSKSSFVKLHCIAQNPST